MKNYKSVEILSQFKNVKQRRIFVFGALSCGLA